MMDCALGMHSDANFIDQVPVRHTSMVSVTRNGKRVGARRKHSNLSETVSGESDVSMSWATED